MRRARHAGLPTSSLPRSRNNSAGDGTGPPEGRPAEARGDNARQYSLIVFFERFPASTFSGVSVRGSPIGSLPGTL